MSHSDYDRAVFASAPEWRRLRARIAADVRHGNDDRARDLREVLPCLKHIGMLRALTSRRPGIFELGTKHADFFYRAVDQWGSVLAPTAFRKDSP